MDAREVVRRAQEAGVKLVIFWYCDNGGIIRGKATHISGLEQRMETGIGLTVAMQAMNSLDQLQPVPGLGPIGEVRMVPDPDTFVVLPYAPSRASMVADLLKHDHTPWEICTRSFLKRMEGGAVRKGLHLQAAFESEWTLARKEGDTYVGVDESLWGSSLGMTTAQAVIDDIVDALEAQGMRVQLYHPELSPGQQEISVAHTGALRAADNQVLYRETVRNVAFNHGLYASFAAKPFPTQAGNGAHIHLSLWDAAGKQNLLYDPKGRYGLSELAYAFVAGVLEHLPGLVALTAPTVNSYRRLQPRRWASAYVCLGPDNREAAVRIASTFWGQEMASTNLEYKPVDNTCNPYLALGGLLAAGLDGVQRGLSVPQGLILDVDPATLPPQELERRGVRRLPANLGDALDALQQDQVLLEALGPGLAGSFLAVKRSEWEHYAAHDEAYEIRHHFYKY